MPSSHLAESAMSSSRKSIPQRQQSGSPVPRVSATGKKLSLEDRLKASLTAADASSAHKPQGPTSTNHSPVTQSDSASGISDSQRPASPNSIPLPDSPVLSPISEKPTFDVPTHTPDQPRQETEEHEAQDSLEDRKSQPPTTSTSVDAHPEPSTDVQLLRERLKQVEQRFLDVSESFKKLQAERDVEAKLRKQEEQISENHRVELRSQADMIERLRSQVSETEALFKASLDASSQAQNDADKQKDEFLKLRADLEQAKNGAKEEEEKRVKAITLLKTVRQKLVKTEKERDDALKEVVSLREREQGDRNKEQTDKVRLQDELNAIRADKERTLNRLKAQFEKEILGLKERNEKEISALRGQFELDSVTLKASYTKELSQKSSQIAALESSLNTVTQDKNQMFDQLQIRQAEAESIQSHLESVQNQNMELQHQLRENQDRLALLTYDLQEAQRELESRLHQTTVSPEEVARLLSSTELKYESKMTELTNQVRQMEAERNEGEERWSRKLREKTREVDDLKNVIEANVKSQQELENVADQLRVEKANLQAESRLNQQKLTELLSAEDRINNIEKSSKEEETQLTSKIHSLERQLEEASARETQLRLGNKTLREELRKVQASIALLERQRSPAISYSWSQRSDDSSSQEPRTSTQSESGSRPGSPSTASIASSTKRDEDVNVEYLRNVILQFLEHKEMRPNLVRVISTLLRFTPQETRRLIAKV